MPSVVCSVSPFIHSDKKQLSIFNPRKNEQAVTAMWDCWFANTKLSKPVSFAHELSVHISVQLCLGLPNRTPTAHVRTQALLTQGVSPAGAPSPPVGCRGQGKQHRSPAANPLGGRRRLNSSTPRVLPYIVQNSRWKFTGRKKHHGAGLRCCDISGFLFPFRGALCCWFFFFLKEEEKKKHPCICYAWKGWAICQVNVPSRITAARWDVQRGLWRGQWKGSGHHLFFGSQRSEFVQFQDALLDRLALRIIKKRRSEIAKIQRNVFVHFLQN